MFDKLISAYFSSTLLTSHSQVYHSLAELIRWADHILLSDGKSVSKESAHNVIEALEKSVKV